MSVTTRDIFGALPAIEPATPGSYGEAPSGFRLPAATSVGAVTLQVADLERSLDYYRDDPRPRRARAGRRRRRARSGRPVRSSSCASGAARGPPVAAGYGLFHFAILLPDRPALGRFVQHLADLGVHAGAGDHLVSEAFYLSDPDGLGIEVYADRPRETWRRNGRELLMATDPVDVAAVVAAAGDGSWTGMPEGTTMGHVHLHVGDLALASRFYSAALGLDRIVWSYPGALFLSAGGYHHHLGTNVWAGSGARPPEADQAQLLEWTTRAAGCRVGPERRREPRQRGICGRDRSRRNRGPDPGPLGDAARPRRSKGGVMSQPRIASRSGPTSPAPGASSASGDQRQHPSGRGRLSDLQEQLSEPWTNPE